MREKIKKIIFGEGLRYLVVGGCTTLVNFAIFGLLCYKTPLGDTDMGITISNFVAVVCSIFFAYVMNKIFVFRSKTNGMRELLWEMARFVGARVGTMIIEVGGVWLLVSVLHWNEMLGKLLTQVFVVVGNYLISKFFVFKGSA